MGKSSVEHSLVPDDENLVNIKIVKYNKSYNG
jgi:hypothetical protein